MSYETISYEVRNMVGWLTLDRPDALNAYNSAMEEEVAHVWHDAMRDDAVRCMVVTATGDRAFCVGVDRSDTGVEADRDGSRKPGYVTQWWFDDPGRRLGPKSNDFWKPVIAAVNGMACGGAFYILGEADFIIAASHATFFDPHVTHGMTAAFEPMHLLRKMPLQEVLRISLLGAHERMSAQRAREVGLVSEVVDQGDLESAASWAAGAIASAPPLVVQGTLRAIWMAASVGASAALEHAYLYTNIGNDQGIIEEKLHEFRQGRRTTWRLR